MEVRVNIITDKAKPMQLDLECESVILTEGQNKIRTLFGKYYKE